MSNVVTTTTSIPAFSSSNNAASLPLVVQITSDDEDDSWLDIPSPFAACRRKNKNTTAGSTFDQAAKRLEQEKSQEEIDRELAEKEREEAEKFEAQAQERAYKIYPLPHDHITKIPSPSTLYIRMYKNNTQYYPVRTCPAKEGHYAQKLTVRNPDTQVLVQNMKFNHFDGYEVVAKSNLIPWYGVEEKIKKKRGNRGRKSVATKQLEEESLSSMTPERRKESRTWCPRLLKGYEQTMRKTGEEEWYIRTQVLFLQRLLDQSFVNEQDLAKQRQLQEEEDAQEQVEREERWRIQKIEEEEAAKRKAIEDELMEKRRQEEAKLPPLWECIKVFSEEEIQMAKAAQCSIKGCKQIACVSYLENKRSTCDTNDSDSSTTTTVSITTTTWNYCVDCQLSERKGWPYRLDDYPVEFISTQHRKVIAKKCSKYDQTHLPTNIPIGMDGPVKIMPEFKKQIRIRAGETIEYYDPIFRFGDERGHRKTRVLRIDGRGERGSKLIVENGEIIPDTTKVCRLTKRTRNGQFVREGSGLCMPIDYYILNSEALEGEEETTAGSLMAQTGKEIRSMMKDAQDKVMTSFKKIYTSEKNEISSDGGDDNDDGETSNRKRSRDQFEPSPIVNKKRSVFSDDDSDDDSEFEDMGTRIVSQEDPTNLLYDELQTGEDQPEEQWDCIAIFTKEAILQRKPTRCKMEGCNVTACVSYSCVQDPTNIFHYCVDCQRQDFGGWPETLEEFPIKYITEDHRKVIEKECSKDGSHELPAFVPTSSSDDDNVFEDIAATKV